MTTSDFSVALKKSVPPTIANSDSKTLGTPTLNSTAIPARFDAELVDYLNESTGGGGSNRDDYQYCESADILFHDSIPSQSIIELAKHWNIVKREM